MLLALLLSTAITVQHEGRLLDPTDAPAMGQHSLTLTLYSDKAGGTSNAVWTDTFKVNVDKGGLYALTLGDTDNQQKELDDTHFAGPRWLGIAVDAGGELSPLLRLSPVPNAAHASTSDAVVGAVNATGAIQQGGKDVISADGHFKGPTDNLDAHTVGDLGASATAAAGSLFPLGAGGKFPPGALDITGLDATSFDGGKKFADVTNAINVASQAATAAVAAEHASAAQVASANAFTGSNTFAGATTFGAAPSFNPGSGAAFTLGANAIGTLIPGLNAEKVGGHPASDFLLAASYHPVGGVERLVLNFEEGGSNSNPVLDGSGAANTGSLTSGGLARVTTGHNGSGGIQFLGGGGLLTIPDAASLDVTNNITLEAWINPTAPPPSGSVGYILYKDGQYGLALTPSGAVEAFFFTAVSGTGAAVGATAAIPLNTWTHVAASYDGLAVRVFLNGTQSTVTTYQNGPLAITTNPLTVGGKTTSSATSFNGIVDEVRVAAVAKELSPTPKPYVVAWAGGVPIGTTNMATQTINGPATVYAQWHALTTNAAPGGACYSELFFDATQVDGVGGLRNGSSVVGWFDSSNSWAGQVPPGTHTVSVKEVCDTGAGSVNNGQLVVISFGGWSP